MCPPSSWPTGRRLSRVKNIPTQPPITTGCAVSPGSSYAVGCPMKIGNNTQKWWVIEPDHRPRRVGDLGRNAERVEREPDRGDDDGRDQPGDRAGDPDVEGALREGIRPRIRMIAPRVPNGNTNGMTYGSETSTPWYRPAT